MKHSLVRHQRIHLKPRGADGASTGNDDVASEDGDSCTPTPPSTCPPSENESDCGSGAAGAKELEEEVKEETEGAKTATETAVAPGELDGEKSADSVTLPDQQATEAVTTTNDDSSKDPSPTSSSSSSEEPAAAEGFVQGLLEIHTTPTPECILPNGEPPLVGVD